MADNGTGRKPRLTQTPPKRPARRGGAEDANLSPMPTDDRLDAMLRTWRTLQAALRGASFALAYALLNREAATRNRLKWKARIYERMNVRRRAEAVYD